MSRALREESFVQKIRLAADYTREVNEGPVEQDVEALARRLNSEFPGLVNAAHYYNVTLHNDVTAGMWTVPQRYL